MLEESMTWQQKVWKYGSVVLWGIRPLLAYLIIPSLCTSIGMMLHNNFNTQDAIWDSANFYRTVAILLTIYLFYKQSKKDIRGFMDDMTLYVKPFYKKKTAEYMLTGFCLSVFISSVLTVLPLGVLGQSYAENSLRLFVGRDLFLVFCSTVVLAPVAEELIFRGMMLNRFLTVFSERTSVCLVAGIFAICHVQPLWVIYAFLVGLAFTKAAMKEDNIWYSLAMHVGFNSTVLINMAINYNETASDLFYNNKFLIAIYGVIAFLILAVQYKRHKE